MTPAVPPIRVEGVAYRYPGASADALRSVGFEVHANELVGVVGPNGGGKTTLIKLLLGLLEPQRGTVEVLGRRPHQVRSRIGYVPQRPGIDASVPATVQDIVLTGCLARSSWGPWFSRQQADTAREALARTELEALAGRPWAALSVGQQQRVLIARALAAGAALLLLDEPTTGVDLHREEELLALLHRLNERLPIVMVSHDVALVSRHMDTALWVDRGVRATPARELTIAAVERFFHGDGSDHAEA